jgi:hypothetical protein
VFNACVPKRFLQIKSFSNPTTRKSVWIMKLLNAKQLMALKCKFDNGLRSNGHYCWMLELNMRDMEDG